MNVKTSWDTTPDMFEGGISNATPQKQQSPLEAVGNDAASIIEALENQTVRILSTNPLKAAMIQCYGGCPPDIKQSQIKDASPYGEASPDALYGLAVFDLYNHQLKPTGAVFTNPTIEGFKDIVFGQGGLYFNRSKVNDFSLIVTDDPTIALSTTYPVYAPYPTGQIKAYDLKALLAVQPNLCFIAPIHQQDDIQRRFTDLNIKMGFIPEPPNLAMSQNELDDMLELAINQAKAPPKGHLAKPFKMDDGSWLNVLENGLYQIKEKQDENGETKQTKMLISNALIILGEARSLKNDNWKRVIQFHDKDRTLHTLIIPYEHFMGEAQDALKLIASHGLMPPRQT